MDIEDWTSPSGAKVRFDKHAICSIVQLPLSILDGPFTFRVLGTGFHLFNKRIVVTAKHLFTHIDESDDPIAVMAIAPGKSVGTLAFSIVEERYIIKSADIALIVLPEIDWPTMVPFLPAPHNCDLSAGVISIGYQPSKSTIDSLNRKWNCVLQAEHATITQIEERERAGHKSEFCISYPNLFVEGGNSGGPLLNAEGRVVGVLSEKFADVQSSHQKSPVISARAVSLFPLMEIWTKIPGLEFIPKHFVDWWFGNSTDSFTQNIWENLHRDGKL